MSDDARITDEVAAEINPADGPDYGPQAEPVPGRPADRSPKEEWVDYVVALGASREMVTADTKHFDGAEYATEGGLTKPQLIDLADRLGG